MKDLTTPILTDTWVTASWDEYIQIVSDPICEKAKCYYDDGQLRIEMSPIGHDHSSDNTVVSFAINLYAVLRNIPLKGLTNCSYRLEGIRECQPDISYYLSSTLSILSQRARSGETSAYLAPESLASTWQNRH